MDLEGFIENGIKYGLKVWEETKNGAPYLPLEQQEEFVEFMKDRITEYVRDFLGNI